MEYTTELILCIAIIFMTGLLFGKIAKKLNIPSITGYLVGGLLIGPVIWQLFNVPYEGVIREKVIATLSIIADIELAFIAFSVGSEFKVSYFKQVGITPIVIAFAESFAAVIFITVGMLIIGCPLYFALAMGAVGGATAPAATILVIKQYRARGELTKMLMSVVAIDDASALIFFGIAMAISRSLVNPSGVAVWVSVLMPFIEIAGSLILGAVLGILLTIFIRFFKSRGNRLILVMAALFANIGVCLWLKDLSFEMGGGTVHLGMSSLLACMVTGGVLTNASKVIDEVLPAIEAITPPFVVIFFTLSGADLKLSALSLTAVAVLAIYLVFRVAGKVSGTLLSAKLMKAPQKIQKWLGFGLLPQGGIAIGLSMIVMSDFSGNANTVAPYDGQLVRVVVLCAVFASEVFGPLLSKYALLKSGEGENPAGQKVRIKKQRIAVVGAGVNLEPTVSSTIETPASVGITETSTQAENTLSVAEENLAQADESLKSKK